jgi:glycosyltransferase involved in cell wall biosynthesis
MSGDVDTSFLVIAYNEAANITATLDAIMKLDEIGTYEIVVVDDGSTDGTPDIVGELARQCPEVRLIPLSRNSGRGHARARSVSAARGAFIATVDADIILPTDWLVRARAALRGHDAVGGIAVPDGDVQYLYRRCHLAPRAVKPTTTVTGNNALYRRSVFDLVGFDPSLREGEDSAFNYAMAGAGLLSVTVPDLLVRHQENKSLRASLNYFFDIGRGATRQLFTYRQLRVPDLVTIGFVVALLAGLGLIVIGDVLAGILLPLCLVLVAAAQHVRSRFYTPPRAWTRALAAVALDWLLMTAYLVGRIVGLAALRRSSDAGSPSKLPRALDLQATRTAADEDELPGTEGRPHRAGAR